MRSVKSRLCPTITLASFLSRHVAASRPDRLLTAATPSLALMSNSRSIFENLAIEETLLRGVVVRPEERFLFLYVNNSCVVIGRNQNYLREVAVRSAKRDGVAIVRRSSGGGAVFHDDGNVCVSFFTHRDAYHPERTIQLLRLFLCCEFGIHPDRLTTTSRHDLFLDGMKITGSAMRVQRDVAYHHCTLLVSSCLERLGAYLHSQARHVFFASSSLGSVRSPVTTLKSSGVLSGVLRAGGDAVLHTQKSLADFFVSNADKILRPCALREIERSVLPRDGRGRRGEEPQRHNGGVFLLDVAGAVRENTFIVDGEGRKAAAGSSKTVREEVDRLRSVDWLFSMPKFETRVAIALNELLAWGTDSPETCRIPPETMAYLMEHHTRLDITTVVERRRVTSVRAFWVDEAAGDLDEAWCSCILRALLEDTNVDDVTIDISEGNVVFGAALQLECYDIIKNVPPLLPAAAGVDTESNGRIVLCHFFRALLNVWREKNVFVPLDEQGEGNAVAQSGVSVAGIDVGLTQEVTHGNK